jgi:hypothetical protein
LFYANLFDLMDHGRLITVDVERLHSLKHPHVEFLVGSSVEPRIVERMHAAVEAADGPVMVILDSDHSVSHVAAELELYAPFVTPGSLLHVQDGIIDELFIMRSDRPGPLPAIKHFLAAHPEFTWDRERSEKFLITRTIPWGGCGASTPEKRTDHHVWHSGSPWRQPPDTVSRPTSGTELKAQGLPLPKGQTSPSVKPVRYLHSPCQSPGS